MTDEPTLSQDVLEAVPAWGVTLLERLEIVEKMVCDNRESLVHVTAMIIEKDEEFVGKVLGMLCKAMDQGLKEWTKVTELEARVVELEALAQKDIEEFQKIWEYLGKEVELSIEPKPYPQEDE